MSWVADFETITNPSDCRVWAWALCDIELPDNIEYGIDIESFINKVWKLTGDIYFHNLAYDGKFIIDALMRRGWQHMKVQPWELQRGEFTTLISKSGKFYQIVIHTQRGFVSFKDSLKLLPMSVKRVAKAFNLPDDEQKGELDYDEFRPVGHELTNEEIGYIRNDVLIIARALAIEFDKGLNRLTAGSNAFHAYKSQFKESRWNKLFPVVNIDIDDFLRQAYKGGFTYVNPKYKGIDVYDGISVDFNSMYPSMMLQYDYPIGTPIRFEGKYKADEHRPLYVQELTCYFDLKPDKVPMIQLKGNWGYGFHEYVEHVDEPVKLVLCNIDLETFYDSYEVDVLSYNGGYMFSSARGLFDDYIAEWRAEKESTTGGRREIAKLMLNSLYGKFGTNPDVTPRIPVMRDGIVDFELAQEELRDPIYLPVAIYVTAYARKTLIEAISKNWDRFVYCDTDSMHLLGFDWPDNIPLDSKKFGHWKVEGQFTRARHLRAKQYIWDLNGPVTVACAGMPDNVKKLCNFENFHIGFNNLDENGNIIPGCGKLIPRAVPGGVVLEPRPYTLR